jgi:DNA-binding MarR family transcriptional regulator
MPLQIVPAIHRATHRIGLYLADLREHNLSQGEAHILALLAQQSPATVGELHAGLAHKRSTLTSILDRLTERRFVTRTVGKADRRTFVIALTARGRLAAAAVLGHLTALERVVARRVTAADLKAFLKVVTVVENEARKLKT